MSYALATLLALFAGQDDKEVDEAIRQFKSAWWKAGRDAGPKVAAITPLTILRHEKILDLLLSKLKAEDGAQVKEALVAAIAKYTDSQKAAAALVDQLDENRKMPNVMQACFQGLGSVKPALSRPHVAKVNEFIKHKDMSLAVPAVNALACIRHKSSVSPLMDRLRRAQQDMREYIMGQAIKNCDGD